MTRLEQLLEAILSGANEHPMDSLPTFGGPEIQQHHIPVWSWDDTCVIVGSSDLRIITRQELADA